MNPTLASSDLLSDDTDTLVDAVHDLNDAHVCPIPTAMAALLHRHISPSETFVGFEIPLSEMWRPQRASKIAARGSERR